MVIHTKNCKTKLGKNSVCAGGGLVEAPPEDAGVDREDRRLGDELLEGEGGDGHHRQATVPDLRAAVGPAVQKSVDCE